MVVVSRRMRWEGHIAYIGEIRNVNLKGIDHLVDLGTDVRIILK
jgi:hypothetical protein